MSVGDPAVVHVEVLLRMYIHGNHGYGCRGAVCVPSECVTSLELSNLAHKQ